MIFNKFVEATEFNDPEEEFALSIAQYFEMLYSVRTPGKGIKINKLSLLQLFNNNIRQRDNEDGK